MKEYHKNPRTLSEKQYNLLKKHLEELGDLSGIVHDVNSDEIIGGNQRSRIFDIKPEMIFITHKYKTATKTGTIAIGYVEYKGERYSYRKVKWTPKQCERGCVVANKSGGKFDNDILANQFEIDELKEWGFEDKDLGLADSDVELPEEKQKESKQKTCPECGCLL